MLSAWMLYCANVTGDDILPCPLHASIRRAYPAWSAFSRWTDMSRCFFSSFEVGPPGGGGGGGDGQTVGRVDIGGELR